MGVRVDLERHVVIKQINKMSSVSTEFQICASETVDPPAGAYVVEFSELKVTFGQHESVE